MNYTSNYHLPQWEMSDRVMMEDFNQAMSRLDTGLANAVDAAAQSSQAASSAAAKAQSTANSALNTASKAFNPNYLPYKVGTYTGTGSDLSIYLGFQPSFVIFTAQKTFLVNVYNEAAVENIAVAGPSGNLSAIVGFTSSGMTVKQPNPSNIYPAINTKDTTYSYIAFR